MVLDIQRKVTVVAFHTYDSISLDVMINYMLDGIPYLGTCILTVCLSLFHVLPLA